MKPNPTQTRIFDYIILHKQNHDGNNPTFQQIMRACGISSSSIVAYHLKMLRNSGLLYFPHGHASKGFQVVGGEWTYKAFTNRRSS